MQSGGILTLETFNEAGSWDNLHERLEVNASRVRVHR